MPAVITNTSTLLAVGTHLGIGAHPAAAQPAAGQLAAGAWRFARRGAAQIRPAPRLRSTLSFRAVNLPDTPGYDGGLQRHHLLPRQLRSKRCFAGLFREIGREWPGFDDFRRNGMLLPASDAAALRTGLPLHRGPHRDYNTMVIERVGQVEADWAKLRRRAPRLAHDGAVASLQLLQRALRRQLLDPGGNRLALNRFDPMVHGADFFEVDAMVDLLWPASDPCPREARLHADQATGLPAAIPSRSAGMATAR